MTRPSLGALEQTLGDLDLPAFEVPERGREAERIGQRIVRDVRHSDPVLADSALAQPSRIKTSVYVDPALVRQLKARAAINGRPLYDVLEDAIRAFLVQSK